MPNQDKRARKKDFRDQRVAAYEAAMRRRRNIRLIALLIAVAALVGGALFLSGGDDEEKEPTATASPSPSQVAQAACGGDVMAPPQAQQYDEPPPMALEDGVDYGAIIHTSCGDIVIDLLEEEAPKTVNNFVFLATESYFGGQTFHRVVPNFVIQAGDPNNINGDPPDGPGYTIPDELPDKTKDYVYGAVAMANTGQPNSGGSQFFIITHDPERQKQPASLQLLYSLFGRVDRSSYDVVQQIATLETLGGQDPTQADIPVTPAYIESIEITQN